MPPPPPLTANCTSHTKCTSACVLSTNITHHPTQLTLLPITHCIQGPMPRLVTPQPTAPHALNAPVPVFCLQPTNTHTNLHTHTPANLTLLPITHCIQGPMPRLFTPQPTAPHAPNAPVPVFCLQPTHTNPHTPTHPHTHPHTHTHQLT